jgi:hypothetical protein
MTKNIKRKKVKHTKKESLLKSAKAVTTEEIFGCVVLCFVVLCEKRWNKKRTSDTIDKCLCGKQR